MLYITNSPIIPIQGIDLVIRGREIGIDEAKELINKEQWKSAIGHKATAELLSMLLGKEIPTQRIEIYMDKGDKILAFALLKRLEEGRIIKTVEELQKIGYKLVLYEAIIEGERLERIMKLAKELADCIRNEIPQCDEHTYDWLSWEMQKVI
jgi:hypothetical protein